MAPALQYSVSHEADNQVGPAFHQEKSWSQLGLAREQLAAWSSLRKLRGQMPGQATLSYWGLKQRWCQFTQTRVRKSKASLR